MAALPDLPRPPAPDADLRRDYLQEKEKAVSAAPEIRGKYNEAALSTVPSGTPKT